MTSSQENHPLTPERLMQFAWGYSVPLMIETGLELGVFDLLAGGAKSVAEVSRASGASERGLRAVMNALVAFEFLAKDSSEKYSLTPESSAFLVSQKPGFQGGIFRHISRQLLPVWMQLTEVVRTGKPGLAVNREGDGSAFFQQLVEDIFPMSYPAASALAAALKLKESSQPVRVLDLAAGSGVWGIALAQASANVSVTAVDWEGVLPATVRIATKFGVADRFKMIAGDLLTAGFGTGYDVATLGHILHSEGAQRSRELLKKTFAALAPGGTIAIAEFVANDDRTGPPGAMIFAVNMLVNTDTGDTFTFPEMSRWLTDVGFKDVRQLAAPGPSPLILASKPNN
jgi:ubiquinone/menaquinone biosynthesis C-methylase UbiE